jgi:hypothetical protein
MEYDKTVKDIENDTANVAASDVDPVVELWTRQEIGPGSVYLALTPKAARRLARHLKRAANVAEGKPAKAPKVSANQAREIVDRYGIVRTLRDNGRYSCATPTGILTREEIDCHYGIAEVRP